MKLLKFGASWCGPCKMLTQVMSDMEFPYEVQEIDIEDNEELVAQYNIRGVPTLVLLNDDGAIMATHVGAMDKTALEATFINN